MSSLVLASEHPKYTPRLCQIDSVRLSCVKGLFWLQLCTWLTVLRGESNNLMFSMNLHECCKPEAVFKIYFFRFCIILDCPFCLALKPQVWYFVMVLFLGQVILNCADVLRIEVGSSLWPSTVRMQCRANVVCDICVSRHKELMGWKTNLDSVTFLCLDIHMSHKLDTLDPISCIPTIVLCFTLIKML